MESATLTRWLIGLATFRRETFRDMAQAPVTPMAAAVVAAGGLLVNSAGAWAAGLPIESFVASAVAGVTAALLAWVCMAALTSLVCTRWLGAGVSFRSALRLAGFASVWRLLGMVPPLTLAGDVLAAITFGIGVSAIGPSRFGKVVVAVVPGLGCGLLVNLIANRLVYSAALAVWQFVNSIQW